MEVMMRIPAAVLLCVAGCAAPRPAGSPGAPAAPADSAFAALQARGASPGGMGVDQYTSAHRFDDLADGGSIRLERLADDPAGIQQIRAHMRQIADAFARGDFRIPGFVHDSAAVPATAVMAERRSAIRYAYGELPRGGMLRIQSADPEAVAAIHAFLAFQRMDHRAGGHDMHHR
jgi:hypothetical protein